jgi:hypothetical protein
MIIFSPHPEAQEDEILIGINKGNCQDFLTFKTARKGKIFDKLTGAYPVFIKKEEVADHALPIEVWADMDVSWLTSSQTKIPTITKEKYYEELDRLIYLTRDVTSFISCN